MRRLLTLVLYLACGFTGYIGAACTPIVPVPVVPPAPPPVPVPVPPAPPVPPNPPAPVVGVVPYSTAHAIVDGASRASVEAGIGFPAMLETRQDDGTTILRWAAVGSTGAPKYLDVQISANGLVAGHALLPRAP